MEHNYDVYVGRPGEWTHVACTALQHPGLTFRSALDWWQVRVVVEGADPDEYWLREEPVDGWLPYGAPAGDDVPPGGSLENRAVLLEWRYGNTYMCCIESGFLGVSLCGRQLSRDAERLIYQPAEDHDSKHSALCFDCTSVGAGGEVSARRRELHF